MQSIEERHQAATAAAANAGLLEQTHLSFGEICPSWSARIEKGLPAQLSPKRLRWHAEMVSPETCIVGEAHGFSSSYMNSCETCRRFSSEFPHDLRDYSLLKQNVREFVEHWNRRHSDITMQVMSSGKSRRRLRWFDGFARFDGYVRTYQE
jgi:hypothetical protein